MIRYPERFHASTTPGARHFGVEPHYQATPRRSSDGRPAQAPPGRVAHPHFDFTGLLAALGR